jgi:hypothetical protein
LSRQPPLRLIDSEIEFDIEFQTTRSRPGEAREPLEVDTDGHLETFFAEAHRVGLPLETAIALALERRIALDDLVAVRFPERTAIEYLDAAAAVTRPRHELGGAMSSYLRLLGTPQCSSRSVRPKCALVPVPLRVYARAVHMDLSHALVAEAPAQALAWERAAVLETRTLLEWALMTVLVHRLAQGPA